MPTVKTMNNGCDRHRIPRGGIAKTVSKVDGVIAKLLVLSWKGVGKKSARALPALQRMLTSVLWTEDASNLSTRIGN
jgi:hypothetical protein